jgi:hypothetical protein
MAMMRGVSCALPADDDQQRHTTKTTRVSIETVNALVIARLPA